MSAARFTELRRLGVIYEKKERPCRVTGRNVIEWDLTDKLPVDFKNPNKTKQQKKNAALESLRNLYKKRYKKINDNTIDEWKIVANLIKNI